MAAEAVSFMSLKNSLASRKFAPVYLIHGEQSQEIDELVKLFENILPPADRDFNQYILYAPETEPAAVMNACRNYPMMSDYQVVIVKEAQSEGANFLNALAPYAQNPSPTTILVIVGRGKSLSCAELTKAIKAGGGVVYEAKKLWDNQVGPAIAQVVAELGMHIEPKAQAMLQDYVGTDLSRIHNELAKLAEILGPNAMITPESIERNIGISKDFNSSELVTALATRNVAKSWQIVDHFRHNPKNGPTPLVATVLFNFFSNLLIGVYSPDRSDSGLMRLYNYRSSNQLKNIKAGLQNYNAWQMIACIDAIRRFDAQSKGIGSRQDPYDLLEQLVFTILNTNGRLQG